MTEYETRVSGKISSEHNDSCSASTSFDLLFDVDFTRQRHAPHPTQLDFLERPHDHTDPAVYNESWRFFWRRELLQQRTDRHTAIISFLDGGDCFFTQINSSVYAGLTDDEEHVPSLRLPPNVEHAPPDHSLVQQYADGTLAAAFTGNAGIGRAGAPTDGWQAGRAGSENSKKTTTNELFPDAAEREAQWFKETGIYPIHGLIVVKDSLLAERPEVALALFNAFNTSKQEYLDQLADNTSQWDTDAHYRAMASVVGDPLPYGIDVNRPSIEAMLRNCYQQGLLPRHYEVDEMFVDPHA